MFRRTDWYPVPYSYLSKGQIPTTGPKRATTEAQNKTLDSQSTTAISKSKQANPTSTKSEVEICQACNLAMHGEDAWPMDEE